MTNFINDFPFEPYNIQTNFMKDIKNCLTSKGVGIFESPTGTGKTLSLICSSLTWLIEERQKMKDDIDHLNQKIFCEENNPDEDWISKYGRISSLKRKREDIEESLSQISQMKNKKFDHPDESPLPSTLRIFYCSRTHSQLSQFINEFSKTKFSQQIRLVTLGSRQQLCINETLTGHNINKKCHDLLKKSSCPFHNSPKFDIFCDSVMSHPMDIEDLLSKGRTTESCPFYASKRAVDYAELVVVPYSVIIHERTRESFNLDISGHVVIVDEAHNLLDSISSAYSTMIELEMLKGYSDSLSQYRQRFASKFSASTLLFVKKIGVFVEHLLSFMSGEEGVFTMGQFYTAMEDFKPSELSSFLQRSFLSEKIGYKEDFVSFDRFLETLSHYDDYEDARVIISSQPVVCLKYVLINPSKRFIDLAKSVRSLILAGGTMRPSQEIRDLVEGHVGKPLFEHYSGHVTDAQNSVIVTLPVGPTKVPLKLNYEAQCDSEVIQEVCRSLVNICRLLPRGGVVCFFPSYEFENRCYEAIHAKFPEFLTKKRKIIREPKSSTQVDNVLRDYGSNVSSALLFCVVGGKLSEGINFKDDMCRLVVVVGMPFPNIKSHEWKARLNFLTKHVADDYSRIVCMRAVNQSIGRSIRHRNDFSAIVLMDQRYGSPSIFQCLPDWLRRNYCLASTFPQALASVRDFFVKHKISY